MTSESFWNAVMVAATVALLGIGVLAIHDEAAVRDALAVKAAGNSFPVRAK